MQALNLEYPFHGPGAVGTPAWAARQAYSLQYISFILIVLTFVIGAFLREPIGKTVQAEASVSSGDPGKLISELSYVDLFKEENYPDQSKTAALAALLRSHDIDLEAEVYSQGGGGRLREALHRARSLFDALAEAGVPPQAVRVYAVDHKSMAQVKVRLFRVRQDE